MQNNIRKSWNNTLASPVPEIKSNLNKIGHFIVKKKTTASIIRDRTWHGKIDIVLFSMFHHPAPANNRT